MENIEIWKDIPDYEGLYQVSNLGRVKSLERNITPKNDRKSYIVPERIRKPNKDKDGYLRIGLSKNSNKVYFFVHRLVALAFLENPENLPIVNHKNEIKADNRVENLEFCTAHYNTTYNDIHIKKGEKISKANKGKPKSEEHKKKLGVVILQYTLNGEFIKEWQSTRQPEKELNISSGNICKCCKGKLKTCGGYIWKYK